MINVPWVVFVADLEKVLDGCDTVLDVGCGANSSLHFIKRRKKYTMGVEADAVSVKRSQEKNIHDAYKVLDVQNLSSAFEPKSFDAVLGIDVIEHLSRSKSEKLLEAMERIAAKRIVVVTPNGFILQTGEGNQLQIHRCGWGVKDFLDRGYTVRGLYGWKKLRKEEGALRFRPKIICGVLSLLTNYLYTHNNPQAAYSLFAWKNVN